MNDEATSHHSIAIVSGKGGSGKTIIAAVMGGLFSRYAQPPILVDADLGTAGLSLYLGLELVGNTSVGLAEYLLRTMPLPPPNMLLQPIKESFRGLLFSAGDHRSYSKHLDKRELLDRLRELFAFFKAQGPVIVDCRGGIDDESLAVCECVEDIFLIVETDTTSYQACQHLCDVLGRHGLLSKLRGFMVNKVFEDPNIVARNGTAVFRSQFLSAIPLDFDSLRLFLAGQIPGPRSIFGIHVQQALHKAYPEDFPQPAGHIYSFKEYGDIALESVDSIRGGVLAAVSVMFLAAMALTQAFTIGISGTDLRIAISVIGLSGLVGSLANTRKLLGRVMGTFLRTLTAFGKRPSRYN